LLSFQNTMPVSSIAAGKRIDAATRFLWRVTGALMLNPKVYEDVEADESATLEALSVVLLSSFAAGVGMLGLRADRLGAMVGVSIIALALWVAWAFITHEIGTRLLPSAQTRATPGELLRTIGFAAAPGVLRVVGVIPGLRLAAFGVTAVWMLAAMIVAVRQALDFTSTARAVAVCVVGWTLVLSVAVVIGILSGPVAH
jgi:hypothetical protein